jgi:hypothetical protein
MPSILLDLTDQEYNSIPGKKRTWVRELVRAAIREHVSKGVGLVEIPTAPSVKSQSQKYVPRETKVEPSEEKVMDTETINNVDSVVDNNPLDV